MLALCRDARFVWNLAVKQQAHWQPGRKVSGYVEQCAQLTEARGEYAWLGAGTQTVQQQALRDFAQAMWNFFGGTHSRPTWRKAGVHEGFRQVAVKARHVDRLNRRFGRVWVPKVGWVRFRLSRPVPEGVKSYRVTRDRAGRWHVAFAHIPDAVSGPGDGSVVGIDRGVVVSAALSTGELIHAPGLTAGEAKRLKVLQRRLARCQRGSNRREKTKRAIAKLRARETDRRKDWVEKTTTDLARRFDVSRSRLRTRRNDALLAGTSHPETARAKRSSSVNPALPDGATPTSTLHSTSPPDGRRQHGETSPIGGLRTVNLNSLLLPLRSVDVGWNPWTSVLGRRQGISLPGFRIPAGSSVALTARSTATPRSPTSSRIHGRWSAPTAW